MNYEAPQQDFGSQMPVKKAQYIVVILSILAKNL